MPLTQRVAHSILSYPCPKCGHVLRRLGTWFVVAREFTCLGCHEPVALQYGAKLKVFDNYLRDHPLALGRLRLA